MATVIDNNNFSELASAGRPLLIDFWAPWCGPCRMMSPVVEELAQEYEGRVIIAKCNVDDAEDVAAQFNIRNIPTLVLMKGGQLVDRFVGVVAKKDIADALESMLR